MAAGVGMTAVRQPPTKRRFEACQALTVARVVSLPFYRRIRYDRHSLVT
jgi:hypothetical protein